MMVLGVGGIRGLVLTWLGCFLSSLFFPFFKCIHLFISITIIFLVRDKGG